ncbi:hypothetical protein KXV96_004672, partial [Aspergillus fumigatus]
MARRWQSAALLQAAAVLGPTQLMMGAVVPWAISLWLLKDPTRCIRPVRVALQE